MPCLVLARWGPLAVFQAAMPGAPDGGPQGLLVLGRRRVGRQAQARRQPAVQVGGRPRVRGAARQGPVQGADAGEIRHRVVVRRRGEPPAGIPARRMLR